ncbi:type VI secretion system tube protein Hcp [Vibrio brasiliensis]|jgi:type VI secretion system Hcp family effector|uniref:type VI secretion system tube protein TssD n=1 Tax=Vibrio brasiliensis TaxID=170652 RepID=UPI001EFCA440|nr:type VI secretion system tube protein TssD [Vibrio brasiliensis]MCG9753534.1 type VI secretion system tube protein Hcp [Vibrio brasiliensis]
MAHTAYLSIIGQAQDCISKGCNTKDSIGNKAQESHQDEITVLACHFTLSKHGQPTELVITKPIDKSSPLLGNALAKQEHLQCTINFYRTNEQGYNENFYTIELVDALITSLSFDQPNVLAFGDEEMSEALYLSYKHIIWKHNLAGTEGYETWEALLL